MKHGVMKRADRAMPTAQTAGIALWRRVADQLERAIADGSYPVDTRLPGEIEIAQRLGVNRHTVRRALAALADRGFVRAERGSGTYVETRRLRYPISSRTRFSEILRAARADAGGRRGARARRPAPRQRERGGRTRHRPTARRRAADKCDPPRHPAQRRSRARLRGNHVAAGRARPGCRPHLPGYPLAHAHAGATR